MCHRNALISWSWLITIIVNQSGQPVWLGKGGTINSNRALGIKNQLGDFGPHQSLSQGCCDILYKISWEDSVPFGEWEA